MYGMTYKVVNERNLEVFPPSAIFGDMSVKLSLTGISITKRNSYPGC
jgi:hypothetical protein